MTPATPAHTTPSLFSTRSSASIPSPVAMGIDDHPLPPLPSASTLPLPGASHQCSVDDQHQARFSQGQQYNLVHQSNLQGEKITRLLDQFLASSQYLQMTPQQKETMVAYPYYYLHLRNHSDPALTGLAYEFDPTPLTYSYERVTEQRVIPAAIDHNPRGQVHSPQHLDSVCTATPLQGGARHGLDTNLFYGLDTDLLLPLAPAQPPPPPPPPPPTPPPPQQRPRPAASPCSRLDCDKIRSASVRSYHPRWGSG
jgi:hypothetical protein